MEQAQCLLCSNFVEPFFKLAYLKNIKPQFRLFFNQKMAALIVNLKWFLGVCVSTINSTTIAKFENENTATKRNVFFPNSATTAERQPTDTTDSNIN